MKIPFNKPHFTGSEVYHLSNAAMLGRLSGNGTYTQKCHAFFEERYAVPKVLLTTSCTDALEMAALLCRVAPGDEVIMPSYTFVSTANAFALRGARIVFADSGSDNPNVGPEEIEKLITTRTRVIVVMHYGGIACDMDRIMAIANQYNLLVVEDAAQCIEATYKGKQLGTIGHLGTFSFHETKNITCGEGGMLLVNDPSMISAAEIIWEKGTNRAAFARGEVEKYEWVSLGSSFLPNELTAAFLYAQLESVEEIQKKRLKIWNSYREEFQKADLSEQIMLPIIPDFAMHNAHLFYITVKDQGTRDELLTHLHDKGIHAVFHYLALHRSPYFRDVQDVGYDDLHDMGNNDELNRFTNAERFASTLLRLPFYYDITDEEIRYVTENIRAFFKS